MQTVPEHVEAQPNGAEGLRYKVFDDADGVGTCGRSAQWRRKPEVERLRRCRRCRNTWEVIDDADGAGIGEGQP
jgi:hypothetical protein